MTIGASLQSNDIRVTKYEVTKLYESSVTKYDVQLIRGKFSFQTFYILSVTFNSFFKKALLLNSRVTVVFWSMLSEYKIGGTKLLG